MCNDSSYSLSFFSWLSIKNYLQATFWHSDDTIFIFSYHTFFSSKVMMGSYICTIKVCFSYVKYTLLILRNTCVRFSPKNMNHVSLRLMSKKVKLLMSFMLDIIIRLESITVFDIIYFISEKNVYLLVNNIYK